MDFVLCRHCHLPQMNCSCEDDSGFNPPHSYFSNGLSPAEAERLALLIEEAAEVQQIAAKILRHGYNSSHPEEPAISNRSLLERELGDLKATVHILYSYEDVSEYNVNIYTGDKMKRVQKYLHHTGVNGG